MKSNSAPIPSNVQNSPRASSISLGYSFPASYGPKAEPSPFSFKISPGRRSNSNGELSKMVVHNGSVSTSHRLTPTSSTSPSPRHLPLPLPSSTPRMPSQVGRRASVDSNASNHSSTFRRTSMSMYLGSNASPTERSASNLRHVGEGVLDDSDSSSPKSDEEGDEADETAGVKPSDPEILRPAHSPLLPSLRTMTAPSPLSRVAGRHAWTEDELEGEGNDDDNASSPSPQSTDTDSNVRSSSKNRRVSRVSRRNSGVKSRSRSATAASLSGPPRPSTIRQNSRTSIRTVIAGETSPSNGIQPENSSPYQRSVGGHGRQRSLAISELMLNGVKLAPAVDQEERIDLPDDSRLSERRIEAIVMEETRFKETTLCALREALEVFAEEVCLLATMDSFLPLG
jgi:WD repeat-containing protein 24